MMPLREPWGLLKSRERESYISMLPWPQSARRGGAARDWLTFYPCRDDLEGIDHLGVETRRQLDAHACREQDQIEDEEVPLLEEPFLVLVGKPGDDGIRLANLGVGGVFDHHGDGVAALVSACLLLSSRGRVNEMDNLRTRRDARRRAESVSGQEAACSGPVGIGGRRRFNPAALTGHDPSTRRFGLQSSRGGT